MELKDEVKTKVIDGQLYAEGASFIEALRGPEMPDGMHDFNYQYEIDSDELYFLLSEYDYDEGRYIREEFETLLDNDAIVVTSYSTDTVMFILFIDSTEVVRFIGDEGIPELTPPNKALDLF